ncbi:hypothetical protein [Thalassovita taeanensis]|uniref:Uncharacterized protein n=1 Tax=Thalassovita taeanensis TaxID=657014 RepID=A0A1H9JTG1_9RHOB|nr:hypothetical protein [Thalassovita taeanensis]SEQ90122.1 hypothetical protein SAMN04488092_11622 [Thalassovita taeanensis]
MIRFLTVAALVLAGPAFAETDAEKQDRCALQSDIVAQAVDLRSRHKSEMRATKTIQKAEGIAGTKYQANVDVLVNWVYSLPDDQVNEGVARSFTDACLAYSQ